MKPKPRPRILTLDIETSPLWVLVWRLGKQYIGIEQVMKEWTILSYCAKWSDSKKYIYEDAGGRGAHKTSDDSKLLKSIHKLLHEADIVVAQNGKRFDIKKINARLIMAGYKPYSPIRVVDTYQETKRIAEFTSHKLAWMSVYLAHVEKSKHREFPGLELWIECMKDNPKAWASMRKYNPTDVIATEQVYFEILGWINSHPNMGVYSATEKPVCTNCGSPRIRFGGTRETQQGVYRRTECRSCGKWGRMKQNLLDTEQRSALLVG